MAEIPKDAVFVKHAKQACQINGMNAYFHVDNSAILKKIITDLMSNSQRTMVVGSSD